MLEMLFITPEDRGNGLGRTLIQYGIDNYSIKKLAVNEQNPLAKGFYEHMGFQVYKRTDHGTGKAVSAFIHDIKLTVKIES